MYSSKKDKFNIDLLKAELAKAKELRQAINANELTAFDQAILIWLISTKTPCKWLRSATK